MSEFVRPRYQNAPIAEALIDIRVMQPDAVTLDQLTSTADALGNAFPVRHPINYVEFGFDFAAGAAKNNQSQFGWRLEAENRVLQLQRIGFTYSHLPPYTDWDTFRNEARECWNKFRDHVGQSAASRIAVRIINKIPVPQGEIALEEYLSTYPVVPPQIPATATAAYMRLQFAMPKVLPTATAILNVARGMADQSGPHLVLDIDLFATGVFEGDNEIWTSLEKFGIEKDVIFESCITDKVRKAIQ
ncbi:uncharacterized protein (TIGR04255 family) [Bradyrhizobium sp. AZCC 1577]|uniref:TIGR04255 family protein n=1 Tax=Bradyrhizobium sp. AZCC 1577 TaxID=3117019 RepID=UPI002FF1445F